MKPNFSVTVYTDGSCSPNPGEGGWGALVVFGEEALLLGGHQPKTTNNRMEATAVLHALEACQVVIHTDSTYVRGNIDLVTATGYAPEVNRDIWLKVEDQTRRHRSVNAVHVPAHSGDVFNELVDALANKCRKENTGVRVRTKVAELPKSIHNWEGFDGGNRC
jgi:ribonuclease HI